MVHEGKAYLVPRVSAYRWAVQSNDLMCMYSSVYSWLTGRVIEDQIASFRAKLEELTSLGSMINLELEQYVPSVSPPILLD